MQEFEDLGPEYRQGTYLGRLPKELRQLVTRYEESCNYEITINSYPTRPNKKAIVVYNKQETVACNIHFERGIRNNITMREFILNVKQGILVRYNVSSLYSIKTFNETSHLFGLYNRNDPERMSIFILRLCHELEDALYEMERFQNS